MHFDNPEILASVSRGLGSAMRGLDMALLGDAERMQLRSR